MTANSKNKQEFETVKDQGLLERSPSLPLPPPPTSLSIHFLIPFSSTIE